MTGRFPSGSKRRYMRPLSDGHWRMGANAKQWRWPTRGRSLPWRCGCFRSQDPRSVETRSHAKRGNPTNTTRFTDRRGYARWPSSLVWTCSETRCKQRHPQSGGAGSTWSQVPAKGRGRPKNTWNQHIKDDWTWRAWVLGAIRVLCNAIFLQIGPRPTPS